MFGLLTEIGGLTRTSVALTVVVAGLMLDSQLVPIRVPQFRRRQTRPHWRTLENEVVVAAVWGMDLGLLLNSLFTFSGAWVLLALVFAFQDPLHGAVLFTAYWLGRALSVWFGPLFMTNSNATVATLEAIGSQHELMRRIQVITLIVIGVLLALALMEGHGIAG
ncbi:MAG: hypothetical protein ACJ752_04615 [Gaiellaceae bacterium]